MAAGLSPTVLRDTAGRRLVETDRHATETAVLRWRVDGALDGARVRLPGGAWVTIEPRADHDATGAVDRLRWGDGERDATVFGALEYQAIDHIPVLAEPARLPPGAGTAVLNLIASLAADQRRAELPYAGPYPTEQLFTALLESFRYRPAGARDPLARFASGALAWAPAPHERHFDDAGVYVQCRGRVEKVVARGVGYYRSDWQSVHRHAPRRVRDEGGLVRCSLWALNEPVAEHLVLTPAGDVLDVLEPPPPPAAPPTMPPDIARGIVAVVTAQSAPTLVHSITAVARGLRMAWGPVERDLIAFDHADVTLSLTLRAAIARRLRDAPDRRAQLELAFAALAEMAMLAGDRLRALAQMRLAAASIEEQATAVSGGAVVSADAWRGAVASALKDMGGPEMAPQPPPAPDLPVPDLPVPDLPARDLPAPDPGNVARVIGAGAEALVQLLA